MTADKLAYLAGVVLSLAFSYIPGLKERYDVLDGQYKRLVMAGLLLLVAAATFGLSCAGILEDVTCSEQGLIGLAWLFIDALIANQATYLLAGTAGK